jgi:hypothetical protein
MITKISDKMELDHVNLENILTPAQLLTLRISEEYGWDLYFVRRENLEFPLVGIMNVTNKSVGVIDKDGNYIENPAIETRINPEISSMFGVRVKTLKKCRI